MQFKDFKLSPLEQPGLSDYHCHCDYSADASGSIDDYCQAAIQRGLAEICFVTHYDTNPNSKTSDGLIRIDGKKRPVSPDNLAPYVDAVKKAHEDYYPAGLSVKLGIEIGWWEGCTEPVARLRERYQFDHVLVGVHEIDDKNLVSRKFAEYFSDYPLEQLAEKYYRQMIAAAATGLFDALAHAAYYIRYGQALYGDRVYAAHEPHLPDLFTSLKKSGTALEINTAAIRHGLPHYYPPMDIINSARRAGVAVAFLGSDAHRPDQVGLDFEAAAALMPDSIISCDD